MIANKIFYTYKNQPISALVGIGAGFFIARKLKAPLAVQVISGLVGGLISTSITFKLPAVVANDLSPDSSVPSEFKVGINHDVKCMDCVTEIIYRSNDLGFHKESIGGFTGKTTSKITKEEYLTAWKKQTQYKD